MKTLTSRFISALLLLQLALLPLMSQELKPLTLADVIRGTKEYTVLAPALQRMSVLTPVGALYHKRGEGYFLLDKQGRATALPTANDRGRFSIDPYSGALMAITDNAVTRLNSRTLAEEERWPVSLKGAEAMDLSWAGGHVALMSKSNITLVDRQGNRTELTTDGSNDVVYGMPVHRNEFGTNRGTLWSPSGRYLLYYRVDRSEIEPYPLVDMNAPIAKIVPYRYPMAGRKSESVTLHIYDVETKERRQVRTDAPTDSYLTNWVWVDDNTFLIEHVSRDQKRGALISYSATTGAALRTLFTEESSWYVEPMSPAKVVPGGKGEIVRVSRRSGYRHLYLHSLQNDKVRTLTSGEWEVKEFIGIDPSRTWAYYTSNEGYAPGNSLWRVSLKNARRECLTPEKGTHSVQLSSDLSYAIDYFSNIDNPGEVRLIDLQRKPQTTLIERATTPLQREYDLPTVTLGTLKSADGTTDLHYKLTRPSRLEPGKRYPAIIYVYGGPHAQLVTDSWSALRQVWDSYMAQQEGYVILTIDSRGSAHRGHAFEAAIHRNLGVAEMADQMQGVELLRGLGYIDMERIGVHGWSYGGFMTTNLMLTHGDIFKVGVAGGPVMDWSYYEVMYGERYMGTPQDNPEGYKRANLIERAGDLQGRLLLIHGDVDPVVVWQHTLLFFKSAVKQGTLPDYMVYPGHEHNVIGPDRLHLYRTISRYFTDHL